MADAAAVMTRTRTRLLLDAPWFGSLAMRLALVEDPSIKTMATDGTEVRYNAAFALSLTDAERAAVLAHEVMHCALLHPFRRGGRDQKQWNVAADYAINGELTKAGFKLPKDALLDAQYANLSADVIYAKLGEKKQQGEPQPNTEDLSTGSVEDAPAPGQQPGKQPEKQPGQQPGAPTPAAPMTEADWQIAAEQATAVANAAGKTPGGAARAAKAAQQEPQDWRAELREFVQHQQPADFSWSTPNRRHLAEGLYLPGIYKENIGTIAVAIDVSGSVSQALLDAFAAELTAIIQEARPERLDVVYCDTKIRNRESFSPDDPEVVLKAVGGGGTRFSPVFDDLAAAPEPPVALIYFTDLLSSDRPQEPEYPVLWVTPKSSVKEPPFGRVVRMEGDGR